MNQSKRYEGDIWADVLLCGMLWVADEYGSPIVLSKKNAAELLPILEHFIKTGELPE